MATTATTTLDNTHAEEGLRTVHLSLVLDEYPTGGYVLDLETYFPNTLLSADVQGVSSGGDSIWADITLGSRTPATGATLKLYQSKSTAIACSGAAAASYSAAVLYIDTSANKLFNLSSDSMTQNDDRSELANLADVSSLTVYVRCEGN